MLRNQSFLKHFNNRLISNILSKTFKTCKRETIADATNKPPKAINCLSCEIPMKTFHFQYETVQQTKLVFTCKQEKSNSKKHQTSDIACAETTNKSCSEMGRKFLSFVHVKENSNKHSLMLLATTKSFQTNFKSSLSAQKFPLKHENSQNSIQIFTSWCKTLQDSEKDKPRR